MKNALFELNKDEIEVILYIIGDWQDNKSERTENVYYPNKSTTSTKIYRMFNNAFKSLLKNDQVSNTRKI